MFDSLSVYPAVQLFFELINLNFKIRIVFITHITIIVINIHWLLLVIFISGKTEKIKVTFNFYFITR